MSDKARIGVIGVGYMGEVHIVGLQACGKAEVVAIADVNQERLTSLQQTYGIPRTYLDYQEMLKAEKLDGVVVATPDELHRAPVQAVATAGVHLLLEKPIATTMEDAEAIVAAVERGHIRCVMGFLLRYAPDYSAVKQRFDSGELGIPTTAYMQRACTVEEARRLYGRCSVNQYLAVHDTDFLLWLFGKDLESVYTVKSDFRVFDEWQTADHYWNLLKWKNGASAAVLATWGMPKGHPLDVDGHALFIGTKGSALISRGVGGQQMSVSTDQKFLIPETFGAPAHIFQDGHFADVALGLAEPLITIYDGLDTFKVIVAGDESVRTGQAVKVTL